jgi:hypothetical protein
VATSRAERGIARHDLVGQASCLSHLTDGLEAHPTKITRWKPVPPIRITLRSVSVMGANFLKITIDSERNALPCRTINEKLTPMGLQ